MTDGKISAQPVPKGLPAVGQVENRWIDGSEYAQGEKKRENLPFRTVRRGWISRLLASALTGSARSSRSLAPRPQLLTNFEAETALENNIEVVTQHFPPACQACKKNSSPCNLYSTYRCEL